MASTIKRKNVKQPKKSSTKAPVSAPGMTAQELLTLRDRFTEWAALEALEDDFRNWCAETSVQITVFIAHPEPEGAKKIIEAMLAASEAGAREMARMDAIGKCAKDMSEAMKNNDHKLWVGAFTSMIPLLSGYQQRLIMRNFMEQGFGTLDKLCSVPKFLVPGSGSVN